MNTYNEKYEFYKNKYPDLFSTDPMNLKLWGNPPSIKIDKGWDGLLNEIFEHINNARNLEKSQIIVSQIKESDGELKIYFSSTNTQTISQIAEICNKSKNICEYCGTLENVQKRNLSYFYKSCCKSCGESQ